MRVIGGASSGTGCGVVLDAELADREAGAGRRGVHDGYSGRGRSRGKPDGDPIGRSSRGRDRHGRPSIDFRAHPQQDPAAIDPDIDVNAPRRWIGCLVRIGKREAYPGL